VRRPTDRASRFLSLLQAWGVPPHRLLMVGDSTEDVECGNAAGTATCLIAGGGNETSATPAAPPAGAVPTFSVASLHELKERLEAGDTSLGWGAAADSSSTGSSDGEGSDAGGAGAPPPGLDFLDALFADGVVEGAACSFPRIDAARFGVPPDVHPGSRVLHLQCGTGALTKLLFSAGLLVVGADAAPAAATRRGLQAVGVAELGAPGALEPALALAGEFDAVVLYGGAGEGAGAGLELQVWRAEGATEVARALRPGGGLAVESEVAVAGGEAAARAVVEGAGLRVESVQEVLAAGPAGEAARLRLVARKP